MLVSLRDEADFAYDDPQLADVSTSGRQGVIQREINSHHVAM
jgi:hypothetical protein